jgi:plasmid segregation protein ParM
MRIQGIDAGGFNVKYCDSTGYGKFVSLIGEYRKLNIGKLGEEDMVVEYGDQRYLMGPIVETECDHGYSRKGSSKAHMDGLIRVLVAIHKTMNATADERKLVVGQPISGHIDTEKARMKRLLYGSHTLTVNGVKRTVFISDLEVAPEGAAAGLSDPKPGWIRYIDLGSGTINYGTTKDMSYVDRDSFTERFGSETVDVSNPMMYARRICLRALDRWNENDRVRLLGGAAKMMQPHISEYFPNTDILQPRYGDQTLDPIFGNVVAFYEIAKIRFR